MSDDVASAFACVEQGRVDQAISIIERVGDHLQVAGAYAALVKKAYRELRDVASMLALAEAACRFCLREATEADETVATRLKQNAKTIAYNAAANCWPGWGDEGVVISVEHVQAGLKLAQLSRSLVQELDLGDKALGTAHWLIGALELASGRLLDAVASFSRAEEAFHADGDTACVLMAQGYGALAQRVAPRPDAGQEVKLKRVLDQLRAEGSKQASFFAEQIARAGPLLAAFVAGATVDRP
jgi:hypothetical protein